ncbi:hypothetical protein NQ315_013743, partial [Exocentrus adspersus]
EIPSREIWNQNSDALVSNGLICFTDGSRTLEGTGVGVRGVRPRVDLRRKCLQSWPVYQKISNEDILISIFKYAQTGQRNRVRLVWVPGHSGVAGNDESDALARKGSSDLFTGSEAGYRIPYSYPQSSIANWVRKKCQEDWSRGIGLR